MVQSPQYPDLLWLPPRSYTSGRRSGQPTKIAVHYTAGSEGFGNVDIDGAHYCQTRTDGTSAHYFVDGDSVTHCVRTTDEAHTALEHGNDDAIHYELCGTAQTRAQWLDTVSRATIRTAAKQMARDMVRHNIPLRRLTGTQVRDRAARGICGHVDFTTGWPEDGGTHTDPGPQFPWDVLIADIDEFLGGDMPTAQEIAAAVWNYQFPRPDAFDDGKAHQGFEVIVGAVNGNQRAARILTKVDAVAAQLGVVAADVDTLEEGDAGILAAVRAIPSGGGGEVDTEAVVNELLAKLPPAVLDALSARLRPAG